MQVITCDTRLSIATPTAVVEGVPFAVSGSVQGVGWMCGGPVSDVTVEIYIDGEHKQTTITDEIGGYLFMVNVFPGLHYVQVKFPGEFGLLRYYNGSVSELKTVYARPAGSLQCTTDAECGPNYKCVNNICVPGVKKPTEIPWVAIGLGITLLGIGAIVLMKPTEVGVAVAEAERRAREAAERARRGYEERRAAR